MRKSYKGIFIAAAVGFTILGGQVFADYSAASVPGSADDPVVTKSYVDQQIQRALGGGAAVKPGNVEPAPTAAVLQVAELLPGQTIYGFEGTEFIVRTGRVVSVPGVNGDGLIDLTAGADLTAGWEVNHNHLLLIPRSDSRGLRLHPEYDGKAYIVVRGQYEIR